MSRDHSQNHYGPNASFDGYDSDLASAGILIESLRQQLAAMTAERDDLKAEAHRYQWLRIHGLQRAWVSLGTDCDGKNFAYFKCEFKVPEPPNLPYEDEEGLEWADKDFDAAIDAAISTSKAKPWAR